MNVVFLLCTEDNELVCLYLNISPRLTHSVKKVWHPTIAQDTPGFISLAVHLLVSDCPPLTNSLQHCLDRLASLAEQQGSCSSHNTTLTSNHHYHYSKAIHVAL